MNQKIYKDIMFSTLYFNSKDKYIYITWGCKNEENFEYIGTICANG